MTLLDLYKAIATIQTQIEGNCHVSVSIPFPNTLEIKLDWKIEDKPIFYARCYSMEDLGASTANTLKTFIDLANYAYRHKKWEMTK